MRRPLVLLPALLLAACDGGGSTGSDPLSPAEVAGVYNLCTLRFAPSNSALPVADLLAAVVDTTPPAGRPEATIALAANGTYDLVYTEASTAFLQQIRGSVSYDTDAVALNIPTNNTSATTLLLPRPLRLAFNASQGRLSGDASGFAYPVPRDNYASAAGISGEGLQNTINGTLSAVFTTGACP